MACIVKLLLLLVVHLLVVILHIICAWVLRGRHLFTDPVLIVLHRLVDQAVIIYICLLQSHVCRGMVISSMKLLLILFWWTFSSLGRSTNDIIILVLSIFIVSIIANYRSIHKMVVRGKAFINHISSICSIGYWIICRPFHTRPLVVKCWLLSLSRLHIHIIEEIITLVLSRLLLAELHLIWLTLVIMALS